MKRELAKREIEINALSVTNYLGRLDEGDYPLEKDLSCNNELYYYTQESNWVIVYRRLCNYINSHLSYIQHIPNQLRSKEFELRFAKRY